MVSEINSLIEQLSKTSLSSLVSSVPLTSETRFNHGTSRTISPTKQKQTGLLKIEPQTWNEVVLLSALCEAESANTALKCRLVELQAANILDELYCSKLRGQLANQELKKCSKKRGGKLMGDGLPRLLSGDEFYERVVEAETEQRRAVDEKRTRQQERENRAEALAAWKKLEEERKQENTEQCARYHEALEIWKDEKAKAKLAKQRFVTKKPVLGKLHTPISRPIVSTCREDGNESGKEVIALDDEGSEDSDNE
ncbi:hypothetical protein DFH29DRAFT_810327 [Suillus ampliporus]|nr:hypothetical protein DFH29DRAFT_810327 [Suillus ampliporus]